MHHRLWLHRLQQFRLRHCASISKDLYPPQKIAPMTLLVSRIFDVHARFYSFSMALLCHSNFQNIYHSSITNAQPKQSESVCTWKSWDADFWARDSTSSISRLCRFEADSSLDCNEEQSCSNFSVSRGGKSHNDIKFAMDTREWEPTVTIFSKGAIQIWFHKIADLKPKTKTAHLPFSDFELRNSSAWSFWAFRRSASFCCNSCDEIC